MSIFLVFLFGFWHQNKVSLFVLQLAIPIHNSREFSKCKLLMDIYLIIISIIPLSFNLLTVA